MELEELSIMDQLAALRITAGSEIPPHAFLFEWNGTPCFARNELVAVTGKAKSGKTYLNSLLMTACAGEGRLGLSRIGGKPLRVVWIDTEQSEDTTCEILRDRRRRALEGIVPDGDLHVFPITYLREAEDPRITSKEAFCQTINDLLTLFKGRRPKELLQLFSKNNVAGDVYTGE